MLFAGIMSGTSLDGVDVAIADIAGNLTSPRIRTVAFRTQAWPRAVRDALLAVSNCDTHTAQISRLNVLLGELYADAVRETCLQAKLDIRTLRAIGCHGQTIFHEGRATKVCGWPIASTLQIGDAAVLAERTGISVVNNFRARDMAAGGQGAPLASYFDYSVLRSKKHGRVVLNLGGIGNITALPPAATPDQIFACDTGPGNMVIDQLAQLATKGKQTYDRGARLSLTGKRNDDLIRELLREPWYRTAPPKTAGREQYGAEFIARLRRTKLSLPDLMHTMCAFTAATVAEAVGRFVHPVFFPDELIASGGGVHNPLIMRYLAEFLPTTRITTTAEFGVDPDAKEAIFFALFAACTLKQQAANLPAATGASRPVVLGQLTFAAAR
jgi:anhydro-N-acetylmuramic acid kinase